jgi:chemotaxis protein CheX
MRLPQILDIGAAAPLWSELARARGGPIDLDASQVERLGGLCLQVLLSAQAAWVADAAAFRIVNPSAAFIEATRLMAVSDFDRQGSSAS